MYENYLINSNVPLKEAMKKLELLTESGSEALYVMENKKLIGTLAISDIRRALIKRDVNNSMPVKEFINTNFKYLNKDKRYKISDLKKIEKFEFIPILDDKKYLIKFESIVNLISNKNKVVLMAGGLGSRLGDLTKEIPKPMLKLGDKPILEIILNQFKKYNFYNFYISVNYKAEKIINYFQNGHNFGVNIKYLKENKKLGTAGCLSLIDETITEPLIVMNGDVICNIDFKDLLNFHNQNKFSITIVGVKYSVNVPYGVLICDENNKLKKIEEKPTKSYLISGGIYVINPNLLNNIPKNKYFDMPMLIEQIKNVGVYELNGNWIDIGKIEDFLDIQTKYAKGELNE